MKALKLSLVLALAVFAFTLPAPPAQAECPDSCQTHLDCNKMCACMGFYNGGYCGGPYPSTCLCWG